VVVRARAAPIVVVLLALTACASAPKSDPPARESAAPGSVIVDRSAPAYTVFTRVPDEADKETLDQLEKWRAQHPESELYGWETFRAKASEVVLAGTKKNDYPECDLARDVPRLLKRYPGAPFGVTWNGGLAYTTNDYKVAAALYERWKADPTSRTRPDRASDPIHPDDHTVPLLGR